MLVLGIVRVIRVSKYPLKWRSFNLIYTKAATAGVL